jgi:hypothetical protein
MIGLPDSHGAEGYQQQRSQGGEYYQATIGFGKPANYRQGRKEVLALTHISSSNSSPRSAETRQAGDCSDPAKFPAA